MRNKFKIKKRIFGLVSVGLTAGVLIISLIVLGNNVSNTRALEEGEMFEVSNSNGLLHDEDDNRSIYDLYGSMDHDGAVAGESIIQATESRYDSRDTITTVRTKEQGKEGLCFFYSTTTVLEYLLAKNGINEELSPKIMDYRFVDASEAYKESGVRNIYYDKQVEGWSKDTRTLGVGAPSPSYMYLMMFSDPLALVSESAMLNIMKENDSRLGALGINNSYDELWSKDYESVTTSVDGWNVYDTKQSYSKINNPDNTEYVVTGLRFLKFPRYGRDDDPDNPQLSRVDVIQNIKNAIKTYGAVQAIINVDESSSGHGGAFTITTCSSPWLKADGAQFVYMNKGNERCTGGSHAIALVGWDDNISYKDLDLGTENNERKGGFIVQNSYGDSAWNYYLGYDSILRIFVIYGIERYDTYDNRYALPDYLAPAETTASGHVYSFKADGKERIRAFTFSEAPLTSTQFDILVSSVETGNTFKKVNSSSFSTVYGINKYEFEQDVIVSGDFQIKLLRTGGDEIDLGERFYNNVILSTDDVSDPIPDDPTPDDPTPDDPTPDDPTPDDPTPDDPTPDDPTPDDPTPDDPTPDEPTPTPDEEDIPVPNTSTDTPKGVSTPNTGAVTSNSEGGIWSNLVMVPVVVVVGVIVFQVSIKISKHPKFGHKDYE